MINHLNKTTSVFNVLLLALATLTLLTTCSENTTNNEQAASEIKEINKPVLELYKNLKVENDSTPDFEYIISLFTETAYLGFVKEDSLILKSPKVYFEGMQNGIDSGMIKLLYEWEIKGETEYFGNVAHHISTYGVYFGTKDSIAERGVTSFQLVKLKNQWKIQSMIWKAESNELKIPATYLD